jgi:hypothetical protein
MLEHSPDGAPPLVAAPRHLRRRRMHTEIPDTLLVPGAEPIPVTDPPPTAAPADDDASQSASQDRESQQLARDRLNRRKRRVALLAVLFVTIAVPVIVLALLLA